MDKLINELIDE